MRRSARTAAALKNFRANLDARARAPSGGPSDGMVSRGPGNGKVVDPDVRRMIDEALASRRGG